jgi:hypothetical protein
MALFDVVVAVENSAALESFRESLFLFPIVEGLHLLGLSVAVGLLALVDLRLAGLLLTEQPVADVVKGLRPWFVSGFLVVFASGLVLFFAKATIFYSSPLFWAKIFLILLAGLNAVYFEINYRRLHEGGRLLPGGALVSARHSGLISLTFWIAIIVFGRLLAYFQANGAS